ncbi:hypothetical protein E2562_030313 [Oryza meyeriana var. granulata]|uniref:Uncharacterized protein n=1 Tax=Oryza meyeriana var. granulata TaxID=110450 RepID=A0A6G1EZQ7_9ORYZ|nr:hypothetical protein E2562_030313 [Oryza meyeriana var. granulata]
MALVIVLEEDRRNCGTGYGNGQNMDGRRFCGWHAPLRFLKGKRDEQSLKSILKAYSNNRTLAVYVSPFAMSTTICSAVY